MIVNYAFRGCSSLTSVSIGNSVTSIGTSAFTNCNNLIFISVESNNLNYTSENGVLFNKSKTMLVQYPISKTDARYILPSSVTTIGESAFRNCRYLTSVEISKNVKTIETNAFAGCSGLTSVKISNCITIIEYATFYNCSNLTSVKIPNSVITIGDYAFAGCSGLTFVKISNSVKTIGDYAFGNCGLTDVKIPKSVKTIGKGVFDDYPTSGTR